MKGRRVQERRGRRASYRKAGTGGARVAPLLVPLLLTGFLGLTAGCATNPVTGRRSLNLFTATQEVEMGASAYEEALAEAEVVTSGPEFEKVQRVMKRLVAVVDAPQYAWEVQLIHDDSTVNAFALPGGKMAVYTGLLPVAASEAGLAVVMGHEVGHVIASHGTERLTAAGLADQALGLLESQELQQAGQLVVGLLSLPYSRSHESEADYMGLLYMARAGYDPREAVRFWRRMSDVSGSGPPEFLSTHPSGETRVKDLQGHMPEALGLYEGAAGGTP